MRHQTVLLGSVGERLLNVLPTFLIALQALRTIEGRQWRLSYVYVVTQKAFYGDLRNGTPLNAWLSLTLSNSDLYFDIR